MTTQIQEIEKGWRIREENHLTGKKKISSGWIKIRLKQTPASPQPSPKKRK